MTALWLVLAAMTTSLYQTTLPFTPGATKGIDHRVHGLYLSTMVMEAKAVEGGARVTLKLRITNIGDRDRDADLSASLLAADGRVLATLVESEEIEEDDDVTASFKFRLAAGGLADVASVHLAVKSIE